MGRERPAGVPPLGARLRYTLGGALPEHLPWVRHDLTDAGWRLRVVGRVAVQLLPFVVVALLVPGIAAFARGLLVALLLLSSLGTVAMAAEQLRDRRLRQHDLPVAPDPDEEYRNHRRW